MWNFNASHRRGTGGGEEGAILGEGEWLQETRGSQGRGMTSSLHTDVLGVHRRMGGEHGGAREGGTH